MTHPPTFLGAPLAIATVQQMRMAIMNGRLLGRRDGYAFYEFQGKMYVMEANKPPSHNAEKENDNG